MYSVTLPFGKHKGKELSTVPTSYLIWMLANVKLSSGFRSAVVTELQGRGAAVPDGPAPKPVRPCQRCGSLDTRHTWQEDRIGRRRIRRTCNRCNGFMEFAAEIEPFITEANANASATPTIDALVMAEAEGIELGSDGLTTWIAGDSRLASERLKDAVRQRGHLLASLLGRTVGSTGA